MRAARRFARPGLDLADLEQVAALGLIKAADRYDAASRVPFEAYAWRLMIGELMHHVRDSERIMRTPRRMRKLEQRWQAAEHELWMQMGREPTYSEVIAFSRLSAAEYRDLRYYRAAGYVVPFDNLKPPDQQRLAYTIDRELDRISFEALTSHFSPLEQTILRELYENDVPLSRLAERLGYSRRHLARLHERVIRKLAALGYF
jgi:RNA polymerase sigma-B factor